MALLHGADQGENVPTRSRWWDKQQLVVSFIAISNLILVNFFFQTHRLHQMEQQHRYLNILLLMVMSHWDFFNPFTSMTNELCLFFMIDFFFFRLETSTKAANSSSIGSAQEIVFEVDSDMNKSIELEEVFLFFMFIFIL